MVAVFTWSLSLSAICILSIDGVEPFASRSSTRISKPKKSSGNGFGPVASKKSKPIPSYIPDDSQTTKNLVQSLLKQECEGVGLAEGTEIGFHPTLGIRGLYAANDFEAGEFLLGIPFVPTCLTLSMDDISIGEPSDAELGLRLLRLMEEGEKSDFWSYFQSLPTKNQNFDATPDFWTPEQLQLLEFPELVLKAKERRQSIEELAKAESVDKDELQFAAWLVKSRGFTLLKPGLKDPDAATEPDKEPETIIMSKTVMIPYVDMINHNNGNANAELVVLETKVDEESFYAVQLLKPVKKGQEITLCYGTGQESTADLLTSYGFIPKGPNHNDVSYIESYRKNLKWSTTLEEDVKALHLLEGSEDETMKKILDFRITMKRALKK